MSDAVISVSGSAISSAGMRPIVQTGELGLFDGCLSPLCDREMDMIPAAVYGSRAEVASASED